MSFQNDKTNMNDDARHFCDCAFDHLLGFSNPKQVPHSGDECFDEVGERAEARTAGQPRLKSLGPVFVVPDPFLMAEFEEAGLEAYQDREDVPSGREAVHLANIMIWKSLKSEEIRRIAEALFFTSELPGTALSEVDSPFSPWARSRKRKGRRIL